MRHPWSLLAVPAFLSYLTLSAGAQESCVPRETYKLSVTLSWGPPATSPSSATHVGYLLQRREDGKRWQLEADPSTLTPTTLEYTAKRLQPGRTYDYQLVAAYRTADDETLLSSDTAPHDPAAAPCFTVLPLPPPSMLRATQ